MENTFEQRSDAFQKELHELAAKYNVMLMPMIKITDTTPKEEKTD
jgi:hypothetical protein